MNFSRRKRKVLAAFLLLIVIFVFTSSYTLAKNSTKVFTKEVVASLVSNQVPVPVPLPQPTEIPVAIEEASTVEKNVLAEQPAENIVQAAQPESTSEEITYVIEEIVSTVTPAPVKQVSSASVEASAPTVTPIPPQPVIQQVAVQPPPPQVPSSGRADEIFDAMNAYRQARGLSTISKSGTLCSIAQNRANENQTRGSLSHDGFTNYVHSQGEFTSMSEVLFWADFQASGSYMVNEGWDKSPAHNQAINDPTWRSGCAGVSGNFAAFEFGA